MFRSVCHERNHPAPVLNDDCVAGIKPGPQLTLPHLNPNAVARQRVRRHLLPGHQALHDVVLQNSVRLWLLLQRADKRRILYGLDTRHAD